MTGAKQPNVRKPVAKNTTQRLNARAITMNDYRKHPAGGFLRRLGPTFPAPAPSNVAARAIVNIPRI
jgi:hypothetical protein